MPTRPTAERSDVLDRLTGDARTFTYKVWATRPHVHRAAPDEVAGLLGIDDVDHLLTGTGLRTPALRLAQDGAVLAAGRYTRAATLAGAPLTGLVDARKVFDLFEAGATVVLQGLHRYWPPLDDLVRQLELALGHPCQANAYLTPPGSRGFALHSDTHDVFVVQTYGRKRWEIHEGGLQEELLDPGTCLYLPAGTPHAARTEQAASLHVTVGVNRLTWRHLVDRVLREALGGAGLDEPLPAGYLDDPGALGPALADRLAAVRDALVLLDPAAAARGQAQDFLTTRRACLRGGLSDRLALPDLTDETPLVRRPGSVCELAPNDDRLRVLLGDRELRVPARLVAVLAHVREQAELRPVDLAAWLDPQSRLVLARRLVREGLLQVRG